MGLLVMLVVRRETRLSSTTMQYEDLPRFPGGEGRGGHAREMQEDRLGFVKRIAREGRDIARLTSDFRVPIFVVNGPDALHELFVERSKEFEKANVLRFSLYPLAGEGLFTSKGELWKKQRKMMAPLFHPGQLASYGEAMVACTDRALDEWRDGETVHVARELTRITMGVAGKTLFDADTFADADVIGGALTTALEWTSHNAPSPLALAHILPREYLRLAIPHLPRVLGEPLARFCKKLEGPLVLPGKEGRALKQAIALLDARVARMIAERRRDGNQRDDLLSRLLHAHDEDDGTRMTDKQVRDEVLTLFVAGHETTATGLAWTIDLLTKNPSLYEAVEREIDHVGGRPTVDDLPRLALTQRCFKEALRLYPPVYVYARQATEPSQFAGASLPRFAVAIVSPYAVHRRHELWPDPETFDPDRFLPENEAKRPKLAYMPFGAGPRVCIGNHFALMEAQLVLARMLWRFRFDAGPSVEMDPGATLRPATSMPLRVHARSHASA
jgi:cytochrome P450